jgi:phosphate transport system permease protein
MELTERAPARPIGQESGPFGHTKPRWSEKLLELFFLACATLSIFTTAGIIGVLIFETWSFFQEVSLWNFLTDTQWTPLFANQEFGILVLISATVLITAIALIVAVPTGLLAAIYLSEYASEKVRKAIKPALEVLAGVPTVVYGYFALLFVTPFLQSALEPLGIRLSGFNALSAGLVMGVMIIPTIASLSEDAIYAVPRSLREGAYAMGATRREVITGVVLPAALSGIVAAFILAVSRAIGETMIVAIAAGQNPRLTLDPTVPVQTMTSFIVQVSLGDTPTGSLAFKTIFAVGMTLFLMTLGLNVVSHYIVKRYREVYE